MGRYENWEQIATFCKKLFKKFKIFTKILKKIWKFSKSKNRKILKLVFGQKKYISVLLRPNYIVFKNFSTKNHKKKIFNFWTSIFFQNFEILCGHFLWGLTPQNARSKR